LIAAILPLLATQSVINGGVPGVKALAAPGILAISIAAADAPMSQRHAYCKDLGILVPSLTVAILVTGIT
jgi:hypothetical protein